MVLTATPEQYHKWFENTTAKMPEKGQKVWRSLLKHWKIKYTFSTYASKQQEGRSFGVSFNTNINNCCQDTFRSAICRVFSSR